MELLFTGNNSAGYGSIPIPKRSPNFSLRICSCSDKWDVFIALPILKVGKGTG